MKATAQNRRLSGIDAGFLYLERKEIPLHIAALCILEEPLPFEEFVAAIESRLHLIPRYRQIVVAPPFNIGYPTLEDDPHFDIRRHIFRVRLDPPGGEAELEELSGRILSRLMDRSKPLWDVYVIDGLRNGRGALLARVHHSMADGVSGASLMKLMMDPSPEGWRAARRPRVRPPEPRPAAPSLAGALTSALHSSLESMIAAEEVMLDFAQSLTTDKTQAALQALVGLLPELVAASERLPFNKPCSGERKFSWAEFDLADAQAIRTKLGGTVNDVILSVVTRAVSRYIELHGESVSNRFIRMICPVSVRRDDQRESLGNQITFLPVALPLDIRDPAKMLRAVASRTEIMKNARAAHLIALLTAWIGSAPPPFQAAFWWGLPMIPLPVSLLNMICTNVPGPAEPLYAAGKRLIASYPYVPTGYELGVNCACHSYAGKLFFGFTADAHVVPDVGHMRDFLRDSFAELCRAAGVKKAHRRAAAPRKTRTPKEPKQKAAVAETVLAAEAGR